MGGAINIVTNGKRYIFYSIQYNLAAEKVAIR